MKSRPFRAGLLREGDPRREVAGLERVAVDEAVLAEDRVVGVEVEAVRAGDEREGLLDVGHQLLRRAGAAGVVAGRLDAAGERAVVVEADDVVALPAVHGDVEPAEGLEGGLDVDAEILVEGLRGGEAGGGGHGLLLGLDVVLRTPIVRQTRSAINRKTPEKSGKNPARRDVVRERLAREGGEEGADADDEGGRESLFAVELRGAEAVEPGRWPRFRVCGVAGHG